MINASVETRTDSSTIRDGVAYAVARDCIVVAAAGNYNSPSPVFPAGYDTVLSVGATGHAFEGSPELQSFGPADFTGRPHFTNYGPNAVDVVAPGIVFSASVASVADANADNTLHAGDIIGLAAAGTSFSSPIVAGLAALIVSRDKDLHGGLRTLTNTQVIDIIQSTAQDLPDDPRDAPDGHATWDNHGRVDFLAALQAVPVGGGGRSIRLAWHPPDGSVLGAPSDLTADEGASKLAATVNEVEPNNTFATAQPLTPPVTVNGQISTSDDGGPEITYEDGTSDVVEDLYKISLSAPSTSLSITLTPNGDSDLDLALYTDLDNDGHYTVEQEYLSANPATGPGQAEALTNITLPAGTYYVACSIYDLAPRTNTDTYDLAISEGAPVVNAYRVYRSTSPGVAPIEANRVGQVTGAQLAFLDTSAPNGDVYYVVTALYGAGESAPSNEAAPGGVDPNAPVVLNPTYKKGKLTVDASGSKIVSGTLVVIDDAETFILKQSGDQTKWVVKKKTRSVPGGKRVAQVLVSNKPARLYVVTPGGLRSAAVTFTRP